MNEILEAISKIVLLISPDKVELLASQIRKLSPIDLTDNLKQSISSPSAKEAVDQLSLAWKHNPINADELASMILASSYIYNKISSEQTVELVWTGPTTPFVSVRRTEQALLQVINAAKLTLFITSFVAYKIPSVIDAINQALNRGVSVSIILESSEDYGGSINIDVIEKIRELIPSAKIYSWQNKEGEFADGRVHSKIFVADGSVCFITSANLTGYAMERNMELGVLITGGEIPKQLAKHIESLILTKVVEQVVCN